VGFLRQDFGARACRFRDSEHDEGCAPGAAAVGPDRVCRANWKQRPCGGLIDFAGDRPAQPVLLDGPQHLVEDTIYVPHAHPYVEALLAVLPLQLLAHGIALLRGLNVDRPRNLAKTVTVA
jgi:hypothetical protein